MENTLQTKVDKIEMLMHITKLKIYLNQVNLLMQEVDYLVNEFEKGIATSECEEGNMGDFDDFGFSSSILSGMDSAIIVDPNGVAHVVSPGKDTEIKSMDGVIQLVKDLLMN
ncbi:hypothetical protein HCA99_13750 [Listeria booriae]|uniref:hypothetical protein n=1 Tax=Listeria booriae TaxID=1552123 RepID=UPI00162A7558|nr:hypothetical protein [Listeria booriae]MBC2080289.1 hypothetical protein [Listeria booriae]